MQDKDSSQEGARALDRFRGMFPSDDAVLWRYNGIEIEVDMFDLEFAERYKEAVTGIDMAKVNELDKTETVKILAETALQYRAFLTKVFGEETMLALLGEKLNARRAINCCVDLFSFIQAQQVSVKDATPSPAPNRQQRREAERKGATSPVN